MEKQTNKNTESVHSESPLLDPTETVLYCPTETQMTWNETKQSRGRFDFVHKRFFPDSVVNMSASHISRFKGFKYGHPVLTFSLTDYQVHCLGQTRRDGQIRAVSISLFSPFLL